MRLKTPTRIYFKAFFSLLFGLFFEDCVSCDFEKELAGNEQLRSASPKNKEKMKPHCSQLTKTRLHLLRKKLIRSFCLIFSAIIIGVLCVGLYDKCILKNMFVLNQLFVILSILSFSWATVGRLGWEGQSFKGDTVFEELDELIFTSLYCLVTFFGVFAVAL